MPTPQRETVPQNTQPAGSGCLAAITRLIWVAAGNFALLLLLAFIATKGRMSVLDFFYWLTIVLILVARFLEIRYFYVPSADEPRPTMKDWRKHLFILLGAGGGAWVLVRLFSLVARRQ